MTAHKRGGRAPDASNGSTRGCRLGAPRGGTPYCTFETPSLLPAPDIRSYIREGAMDVEGFLALMGPLGHPAPLHRGAVCSPQSCWQLLRHQAVCSRFFQVEVARSAASRGKPIHTHKRPYSIRASRLCDSWPIVSFAPGVRPVGSLAAAAAPQGSLAKVVRIAASRSEPTHTNHNQLISRHVD